MGDGFAPFTGPIFRAMQLREMVDDIKFRREQRDRQRQQWQQDLERQKRATVMQDYMTRMALEGMGASPLMEGQPGDDYVAETGQRAMDTPVGRYAVPSAAERATREGTLTGLKAKAIEEVTDPFEEVDLGPRYGNRKIKLPRSKAADVLIRLNPKLERERLGPNDAGDYTIILRDPQTGEEVHRSIEKGAGKSKTERTGSEPIPNFDAEVKHRMDEWRQGHYAQLGVTQDVIDIRDGRKAALPDEQQRAATMIRDAEKELYDRALDSVKNAGKGKSRQVDAPSVTVTPPPTMPKEVKASELGELLKRAQKREPKLTLNELRKRLAAMKVAINEGQ